MEIKVQWQNHRSAAGVRVRERRLNSALIHTAAASGGEPGAAVVQQFNQPSSKVEKRGNIFVGVFETQAAIKRVNQSKHKGSLP